MKDSYTSQSHLRIVRFHARLTQVQLAAEIKRSPAFISRIENCGHATLTPEIAERIGAVVGVSPATLFGKTYWPGGAR